MPSKSKNRSRGSGQRGRSSDSGRELLTIVQQLDRSLARRSDKITIKDKVLVNLTLSANITANVLLNMGSASFGTAVSSIATFYERFRLLKVTLVPVEVPAPTFLCVEDDYEPASAPTPQQIMTQRCSTVVSYNSATSGMAASPLLGTLQWSCKDNYEYHTGSGVSSSDQRLTTPATITLNSPTGGNTFFLMYFTLELWSMGVSA
jgi:hypothetical protein